MRQLGIFAKYWEPGLAKTRLAQKIGQRMASELYHVFLQTLVHRLDDAADCRVLGYWPRERRDKFAELAGQAWALEAQRGEDLGQRMQNHFQAALDRGARAVVLLGSDSPTIPRSIIEMAFRRLESYQVVLGPAEDGGYYLVGVSGGVPPIFRQVSWSTPAVWEQTQRRLREAKLRWNELPRWYDIDHLEDLQRLDGELVANDQGEDWLPPLRQAVTRALQNHRVRHE